MPATGLRIAVADDERAMRQFFQELLPHMGHQVVANVETGQQLVEQCRATQPDMVITDIKMPDMDGIEASTAINREREIPIVLVSAHHEAELLVRAGVDHIMAYLVKPVKPADLQAALTLAMLRFEQYQRVRAEAAGLRQALEDRKVIEQAKGVAMRRLRLDEAGAYQRMRKLSSKNNLKLIDLARRLLEAESVFKALEELGGT
ncbi:MAG TPA: response regulator [Gemmataceae bacterium]|jgi:response regulator NasT